MRRLILEIDGLFAGVFESMDGAETFENALVAGGVLGSERPAVVSYEWVESHEPAIEYMIAGDEKRRRRLEDEARSQGAEQERARIRKGADALFSEVEAKERELRASGRTQDAEQQADIMEGIARVLAMMEGKEVDDG